MFQRGSPPNQDSPYGPAGAFARPACSLLGGLLVLFLEAVNAPRRIHKTLLPRVERVADRADLDVNFFYGGHRFESIATRACDCCQHEIWMDALLHILLQTGRTPPLRAKILSVKQAKHRAKEGPVTVTVGLGGMNPVLRERPRLQSHSRPDLHREYRKF